MVYNTVLSFPVVFLVACYGNIGFLMASTFNEDMLAHSSNLITRENVPTLAERSRFYLNARSPSAEKRDGSDSSRNQNVSSDHSTPRESNDASLHSSNDAIPHSSNDTASYSSNDTAPHSSIDTTPHSSIDTAPHSSNDTAPHDSSDAAKHGAQGAGACIRVGQTLWGLLGGASLMVVLA